MDLYQDRPTAKGNLFGKGERKYGKEKKKERTTKTDFFNCFDGDVVGRVIAAYEFCGWY